MTIEERRVFYKTLTPGNRCMEAFLKNMGKYPLVVNDPNFML